MVIKGKGEELISYEGTFKTQVHTSSYMTMINSIKIAILKILEDLTGWATFGKLHTSSLQFLGNF